MVVAIVFLKNGTSAQVEFDLSSRFFDFTLDKLPAEVDCVEIISVIY